MALSGLHVTCARAGARGFNNAPISVVGKAVWAQTMAAPGTTTNEAPAPTEQGGNCIFQIASSVDVYVAIGPTPNATGDNAVRYFIKGGQTPQEIAVEKGDKLAWVAA